MRKTDGVCHPFFMYILEVIMKRHCCAKNVEVVANVILKLSSIRNCELGIKWSENSKNT